MDLLLLGVAESEMISMRSSSAGWIVPSWFDGRDEQHLREIDGISR